ncbi:MAG TPA: hypothetical protein VN608_03860, partial [Clostridia bacterium]|nr:hypothetical protein [Clostridia bacterium]
LQIIEGHQNFLTTLKMLVPQALGDEFQLKLSELRIEAREFIEEGTKIDFCAYLDKFREFEQLILKIRQYDKDCEGNPWAVPRILLNHIRPNNPQKEAELFTQGSFSPSTLSLITDEQFSKDLMGRLDPFLKQVGFSVIKQLPLSNRAEVTYRLGLVKYQLIVQYSSLVDEYGVKLFDEYAPVPSATEFIGKHQIKLPPSEYDKALGLIAQYLPKDVAFDDEAVDEFAFLLVGDGMYITLQMEAVVKNVFSKALIGRQSDIVNWAQQMKVKRGEPISGLKSRKNDYRRSYAATKEFI